MILYKIILFFRMKIDERSFKFESKTQIDTCIKTINQCNFKITNNNQVKCSIIDCNQTHKHKMKKVFWACNCKQASCNLKDLTYLHYSSSESIYQQRLNEFRVKYE